jgi:hypothetical protein
LGLIHFIIIVISGMGANLEPIGCHKQIHHVRFGNSDCVSIKVLNQLNKWLAQSINKKKCLFHLLPPPPPSRFPSPNCLSSCTLSSPWSEHTKVKVSNLISFRVIVFIVASDMSFNNMALNASDLAARSALCALIGVPNILKYCYLIVRRQGM